MDDDEFDVDDGPDVASPLIMLMEMLMEEGAGSAYIKTFEVEQTLVTDENQSQIPAERLAGWNALFDHFEDLEDRASLTALRESLMLGTEPVDYVLELIGDMIWDGSSVAEEPAVAAVQALKAIGIIAPHIAERRERMLLDLLYKLLGVLFEDEDSLVDEAPAVVEQELSIYSHLKVLRVVHALRLALRKGDPDAGREHVSVLTQGDIIVASATLIGASLVARGLDVDYFVEHFTQK